MTHHIIGIDAWEALDSRALPTVACTVHVSGGGSGTALAPAGASTGQFEALVLRDGGERFGGAGVRDAVRQIQEQFRQDLLGCAVDDVDQLLSGPTNVTLPVSIAASRAAAAADGLPLWHRLANRSGDQPTLPCPMVNIFSGGRHAEGGGLIQDFLAVATEARTFAEAIEIIWDIRRVSAELIATRFGRLAASLVADEGGLAVPDGSDLTAIELLSEAIAKVGAPAGIAIDVAATQVDDPAAIVDQLERWAREFPLLSVEDPMGDNDFDGWEMAAGKLGHLQLVGDDFFATNAERIRKSTARPAANSALIKCDQIGTLTGARAALEAARAAGMSTVVSARSGDTEDSSLADIAVGWDGGQIKIGSLMRSERLAKYNRLLELEAVESLPYSGWRR